MKKTILITAVAILMLTATNQSSAQWQLTGNAGTNASTNFIGTTDNVALKFRTKNIARITITGAGNVGIGTTAPSTGYKLQVIGVGRFEGGVKMGGFGIVELDAPGVVAGRLKIDSAGNVGIGVVAPAYKLDVNGDANINGVRIGRGNGNSASNTAVGSNALVINTTGLNNSAFGVSVLQNNTTGQSNAGFGHNALNANTTGSSNAAFGAYSLLTNFSGLNNAAFGQNSLRFSTIGNGNSAFGTNALYSNTSGDENLALGIGALYSNTTGYNNSSIGSHSLGANIDGIDNVGIGYGALGSNTSGSYNTATGYSALANNTISTGNTANGHQALLTVTTGVNNTGIGTFADVTVSSHTNSTALGYQALASASNMVMLGNTSVTSVKAAGSFVIFSDGRFKKNVQQNVPGLDFINELNPVTYNYDIHGLNNFISLKADEHSTEINETALVNKEKMVYSGFIAQDVEKAAQKLGYNFSGVYKPQNEKDPYGISYSDFVMPLVKAVQELSKQNEELKSEIENLKTIVNSDEKGSNKNLSSNVDAINSNKLTQNQPNPFNQSTVIKYQLNKESKNASIVIRNLNGEQLKTVTLAQTGKGQVTINANELAQGTYTYTLIVDNQSEDTKLMVITK